MCPPSYKCCLRFRACQRVPVWQAGFFGSLPVFLLIRTICVCIGRTLFKSNSETAWLLSPKVPIISILPMASVRTGSWVRVSWTLILSSGKWNYQQGWSRNCQCFAFQETQVSADTWRLKSPMPRCAAALSILWSVGEKNPTSPGQEGCPKFLSCLDLSFAFT